MQRLLLRTLLGSCALVCLFVFAATPALAATKVARAKVADVAKNAKKLNGIRASKTPRRGRLLALDALGRFPIGVIPVDALPTFSAGFGLGLSNNVFFADSAVLQRRVRTSCSPGEAIREIKEDGTVSCEAFPAASGGDITAVDTAAGSGLTGGASTGDVTLSTDPSIIQRRINASCTGGQAMTAISAAGSPTCNAFGDVTGVTAGEGLTGGGSSGNVGLAVEVPLLLKNPAGNSDAVVELTQDGGGPGLLVTLPTGNPSPGIDVDHQGGGAAFVADTNFAEVIVGRHSGTGCAPCTGIGAVVGRHDGPSGLGVRGFVTDAVGGIGVQGQAGISGGMGTGVRGENTNASNPGHGVEGTTNGTGAGIHGMETSSAAAALAGLFDGKVQINGDLTVTGTKTGFFIDDPSDPAKRTLGHTPVESDSLTVTYSGNVRTNGRGRATVRLPAYAALIGEDWRYGLTPIGRFGQAIVAREVRRGAFVIRTEHPRTKVSWTVTGTRRDPYAMRHPFVPSRLKRGADLGRYVHPGAYGKPASLAVGRGSRASALAARAAAVRAQPLASSLPAGGRP